MIYSQYTIIPSDGVVVLDGTAALGVDMTGITSDVHAIQWYGTRGYGIIEPTVDPFTGSIGSVTQYNDYSRFQTQLDQAEAIINAAENPSVYYSTSDGNLFEGLTYYLGAQILVTTPDTPQPSDTTELVPPTPESFQDLYWYDSGWVVSSVDPNLDLSSAQGFLTNAVLTSVAENVNKQSRIYSNLQLLTDPTPGDLPCADSPTTTLSSYQTNQEAAGQAIITQVSAATAVTDLYGVDPNVDPAF